MKNFIFIVFLTSVYCHEYLVPVKKLLEIANIVNESPNATWKATTSGVNWSAYGDGDDSRVNFKNLLGALDPAQASELFSDQDDTANQCENNGLPEFFDAREHWPECASVIGHVYDQGNCGSCWAVATTSVFSDRVCIASKGRINSLYSIQQLLSCCHKCLLYKNERDGCDGGWPMAAWSYIKHTGLSTGGDYGSKQGCQPYLIKNCDHHVDIPVLTPCPSLPDERAPKCKLHCYNSSYKKTFKKDRIKVEKYYKVAPCAAQNEIYKHGSIASFFTVYEDFGTYKSGVYQHIVGKKRGLHVVRVIGWGVENGTPYWLAVNSWNAHWGDKGYFKIKRGSNEVWFEDNLSAGIPKIV